MTESEAKEVIKRLIGISPSERIVRAVNMATEALEEIQQYRAIGTVERFKQLAEQFKPHVTDKTSCPERHCNKCDKYRKENEKYHEIGTVEECREARERKIPKKLIHGGLYACPNCHTIMLQGAFEAKGKCCKECGQVLDWSETV